MIKLLRNMKDGIMHHNFFLSKTANELLTESGIDSPMYCIDPLHFQNYKKLVVYQYNSRGFRDNEWPDDINNHIWCVGDSFTVGLGQPIDEIWPQQIQTMLNERIINISMGGASNDWIARKVKDILDSFSPKAVLIQWSYIDRREYPNTNMLDEDRRMHFDTKDQNNVANFSKKISSIDLNKSKLIHSFIPKFCETPNLKKDENTEQKIYNVLKENNAVFFEPPEQVDFSRDGHHYDILTAREYAKMYVERL